MKNLNSISLGIMAAGFFVLGLVFTHPVSKILTLLAAAILSVIAAIKSFKEKNNR